MTDRLRTIEDRWPLGMSREEAAAYIGVSMTTFDVMVGDGRMPRARRVGMRKIWILDELRASLIALPREGEAPREDAWDRVRA